MRISTETIYNQISKGLMDNLNELDNLNNQISTGKKINKPSDDVLGTLTAMGYKLSISQNNQSEQNITEASNYLNFYDTALTQISDTLTSLKKVTIQTGGTTEYQTYYATQAANLRDSLQDLANSTYLNTYIFSGSQSDQQAYVYDGTAHQYVYQGNSQQMSVSIGTGMATTVINVPGNSANSAIMTPFTYTLQGVETTTLTDGSQVTFTPVPDLVHNSTTIQVAITNSDPTLDDTFSFANVMDMANLISHAWQNQDVDGTTTLTDQQSANRLEVLLSALDKTQNQLLTVQGQIGIRQTQLSDQKTRLGSNTVTQQENLSTTEDANMDETIVKLQKIAATLNALRSSTAETLYKSLFDFLSTSSA